MISREIGFNMCQNTCQQKKTPRSNGQIFLEDNGRCICFRTIIPSLHPTIQVTAATKSESVYTCSRLPEFRFDLGGSRVTAARQLTDRELQHHGHGMPKKGGGEMVVR